VEISREKYLMLVLFERQEADRHTEAMSAITEYIGVGKYSEWDEEKRLSFLNQVLSSRRPLIPRHFPCDNNVRLL